MTMRHLFTSESVSEGHPDKVADLISDEILDALLRVNPRARAAVETLVTRDYCLIAGETRGASVDIDAIVRRTIASLGYSSEGFDANSITIDVRLQEQSSEIAHAVDDDARATRDSCSGSHVAKRPS